MSITAHAYLGFGSLYGCVYLHIWVRCDDLLGKTFGTTGDSSTHRNSWGALREVLRLLAMFAIR